MGEWGGEREGVFPSLIEWKWEKLHELQPHLLSLRNNRFSISLYVPWPQFHVLYFCIEHSNLKSWWFRRNITIYQTKYLFFIYFHNISVIIEYVFESYIFFYIFIINYNLLEEKQNKLGSIWINSGRVMAITKNYFRGSEAPKTALVRKGLIIFVVAGAPEIIRIFMSDFHIWSIRLH